jgi:hypothetical protein
VLRAYLDASNEQDGDPVAVVAGFVGDERQWEAFEAVWSPFLSENGLARFHAAEFWARNGQFKRWSDAQHLKAKGDVCRILNSLNLFGVGAAVNINAFNEWRVSAPYFYLDDPYYFALDYSLRILIRGISAHPKDEGITIYIDQDKKRESLGRKIATWHQRRLRRSPLSLSGPNNQRQVDTHYGSSFDFKPLQAADILAHSTFQWSRDYLRRGELEEPYFLNCMRHNCFIATQYFFDSAGIEADLKFQAGAEV